MNLFNSFILNIFNEYRKYKNYLFWGRRFTENNFFKKSRKLADAEYEKRPYKFEVINFLFQYLNRKDSYYLEIGVRNLEDNFDKINAKNKFCVDPGFEVIINNATFKMKSDEFFKQLEKGEVLFKNIKFDVIFIDGLHLAEQVERDILNSLKYISEGGFVILHDCNPPMEYYSRENYEDKLTYALNSWNGTVWKAFYNIRKSKEVFSCCIDTDWGIGVVSKSINLGEVCKVENRYFEYLIFDKYRKETLNLISFDEFKLILKNFGKVDFR